MESLYLGNSRVKNQRTQLRSVCEEFCPALKADRSIIAAASTTEPNAYIFLIENFDSGSHRSLFSPRWAHFRLGAFRVNRFRVKELLAGWLPGKRRFCRKFAESLNIVLLCSVQKLSLFTSLCVRFDFETNSQYSRWSGQFQYRCALHVNENRQ